MSPDDNQTINTFFMPEDYKANIGKQFKDATWDVTITGVEDHGGMSYYNLKQASGREQLYQCAAFHKRFNIAPATPKQPTATVVAEKKV